MTFVSVAIFSTVLAARLVAAQAPERCQIVGNVSLLWGTTDDNINTATPLGWSTSASAPTDATGHGLLAVRSSISPTLWGAFSCTGAPATGGGGGGGPVGGGGGGGVVNPRANGGTTSGPPGGGGGGGGGNGNGNGNAGGNGGTTGTTGIINMFGAIADMSTNLCLTGSSLDLPNITITRKTCINNLTAVPDFTQAWQWTVAQNNGTIAPIVDSLVFMGTQSSAVLPLGTATNYVPSLVGTGVGAYVSLNWLPGELNPANTATQPGLLVEFIPPPAASAVP